MVRSVSRGVALLFAIVLALASCGSPSYNRSAFRIECEEASGLFITGMADGEVQLGCPSLEIGGGGVSDELRDTRCPPLAYRTK